MWGGKENGSDRRVDKRIQGHIKIHWGKLTVAPESTPELEKRRYNGAGK